jgi:competence ComEA-like helix-hairpin-helix protein
MKKYLAENSFVNLNHQERKSVFFLAALLAVSILVYCLILWWPRKQLYTVSTIDKNGHDSISSSQTHEPMAIDANTITELIPFDPNLVSKAELENFGLSARVASAWTNYTSKGGRFKSADDLKKIYGIRPGDVERLRSFVRLQPMENAEKLIEKALPLDLNKASYKSLIEIGMPGRVANTLINYRQSGKIFKTIQDLKKVIGMNDSLVEILSPFILFEDVSQDIDSSGKSVKSVVPNVNAPEKIGIINLNQSDTTALKYLPGIGSKLASRIVKYRDLLGGFYTVNQLKEVYGLPDSTFAKIVSKVQIGEGIKRIDVNKTDFTKIHHPYMDKKQALIIQNFIKQHAPIYKLEDLKQIEVLESSFWTRMEPYLDFNLN